MLTLFWWMGIGYASLYAAAGAFVLAFTLGKRARKAEQPPPPAFPDDERAMNAP